MPRRKNHAIREIKKEQEKATPVIPIAPFSRLVRDIAAEHNPMVRFKKDAIDALRVDTESFVIDTLHKANCLAVAQGRETLSLQDMRLLEELRTNTIT